jgi:hypothetical protein
MKTTIGAAAAAGLLLAALGAPQAHAVGACAREIDMVTKALSTRDAGSGPTSGARPNAQSAGEEPVMPHTSTAPGTEGTAAMNKMTEGKAASPSDVRQQTAGNPTAGETAATGKTGDSRAAEAQAALAEARRHESAGAEQACLDAVTRAKSLAG